MRSYSSVLWCCLLACSVTVRAEWVVLEVHQQVGWTGYSELTDINDSGEACGMADYVINQSSTAIRFDGTTVTELPHLVPADPITLVTGINNEGVVCGYSHNLAGYSQAVYFEGTILHTIPYPPGANVDADFRAYDINDQGVIVGYFWSTSGERTAFYYQNGVSYRLDGIIRANGLTGIQIASGVNNLNVICGSAEDALGIQTAWTYDINNDVFTVLGLAGQGNTSARDINDLGQTIGRSRVLAWESYRAVSFQGDWQIVDPDVHESQWGIAINSQGRMIGHANTSANRWSWYADVAGAGNMIEISLPGREQLTLGGINRHDWIVGDAVDSTTDKQRGVIIKPPLGDYDHDGYYAGSDLEACWSCISGPAGGVLVADASCLNTFDRIPQDGAVDMRDFAQLAIQFEGD